MDQIIASSNSARIGYSKATFLAPKAIGRIISSAYSDYNIGIRYGNERNDRKQ